MELREQILQQLEALSDEELRRLSRLLPQVKNQFVQPADPARFEEAKAAAARVREILSKLPGSLSDDVIREREDRF